MTYTSDSKALALGGIFMCISAALHVCAIFVTGFYFSAILLFGVGLAYAGIGRSLLSRSDLWAKASLFVMGFGIFGAYVMLWLDVAVPFWWLYTIIFADIGVFAFLGLYILRR